MQTFSRNSRRRRRWLQRALGCCGAILLAGAALFATFGRINDRYFDRINAEIGPHDMPAEERVLLTFARVSRWQYFDASRIPSRTQRILARIEHASPLRLSARSTLSAGVDHIGPCGSLSRSLVVLYRRAGIPARKALLYDKTDRAVHTVVEVRLDGEWRVLDPTYGWIWRRPSDGALATAEDLARDGALFASVQAVHPTYPLESYRYDNVHHLRWEKLPGLRGVRAWLRSWRGEAWVRGIGTPYLYDRPTYVIAVLCLFPALLCLGVEAWMLRRDRRRGGGGEKERATTRMDGAVAPDAGALPPVVPGRSA